MGAAGRALVAATATGVASALVTRALMRAVALLTNDDPVFTPGALVMIAAFYTLALLPGCLALALSRHWWPWLVLGAGTVVLAFEAVAIGVGETADARGMTGGQWVCLVVVLVAMLATYSLQVLVAASWSRRGLRQPRAAVHVE